MMKDYFSYAAKSLVKRKLRSWLTMVGIFIGIAAVVALLSIGQGLEKAILDQFQALGSDKLIVQPKGTGFSVASSTKITEEDVERIARVRGVDLVVGTIFKVGKIEFNDEQAFYIVHAMPLGHQEQKIVSDLHSVKILSGRSLKSGDSRKALMGYNYKHGDVFKRNLKEGDKFLLNDEEFEAVGFMEKIGSEYDDTIVYITQEDMDRIFATEGEFSNAYVRIRQGINPENMIEPIERELRKSRSVAEGQEDFEVQTFEEVLESFFTIFNIVQAVIVGIAFISLIVGGIGIMNTMYTAVLERTKEIGIMKAIGARNSDIMMIFLLESGMLGLAGGIIGVILGVSISKGIEIIGAQFIGSALLKAYFPAWLILGALAFAVIVGIFSGILPARQASSLQPVDALRYE